MIRSIRLHSMVAGLMLATMASLSAPTQAQPTQQDWATFNEATLHSHLIPRYKQLQVSASELHDSTSTLCSDTNSAALKQAQISFHKTMDAWQSIQHIRTGPVELLMRGYSMQFWPDKKGHVGKNLNLLIEEQDPEILTEDGKYSMSVAVRGLPAVERLLFGPNALKQLSADRYRCQLLNQISAYIDEMSTGMASEWQTMMPNEFAQAGQSEESLYSSPQEVSVLLLKPIVESLEIIKDLKIKRALGSKPSSAKMKRLESWRSQRSLDNIRLNFSAVNAIYFGENESVLPLRALVPPEQQVAIDELIHHIDGSLSRFQQPMEKLIITEAGYNAFATLAEDIERLLKRYESAIADSGLFLGFNSRDGD